MYIEYLIQMSRKVLFTFVVNSKDVLLKRTGKKQQNKSLFKNLMLKKSPNNYRKKVQNLYL